MRRIRRIARPPLAIERKGPVHRRRAGVLDQPAFADHPDHRPRRIGAARKAKDLDFIARTIGFGDELIGLFHLVIEAPAKGPAAPFVQKPPHRPVKPPVSPDAREIGHHLPLPRVIHQMAAQLHEMGGHHDIGRIPRAIAQDDDAGHTQPPKNTAP
nr:hypothetical protein [Roseovarius sp.]